jgi:c-di-GMP-binding flagellar brake protein YcgR
MVIKPEQAHRLADAPPPQPISAIVVDLSAGGLLLRSRTPLSVGQQLLLDLDLPEPGGRLASLVEVVRLRPIQSERGQSIEAGCRFVDLPNRDRDRIVKFIFYCQAKLARTGTGLL